VSNVPNRFDLTGRAALITGGAGLLGVEHAAALLEVGATVVLTDLRDSDLQQAHAKLTRDAEPSRVLLRRMDVCRPEDIAATARDLTDSGVRVDILINNAAIDPKVKSADGMLEGSRLESFPLEQWDLQVRVGLTGAFLCSQVFGSAMARDGRGGMILNIASDLSVFAPDQRLYRKEGVSEDRQPVKPVTYSVIKSGLIGLTRYLATYWANCGVRSNALSPGGVFNGQDGEFVRRLTTLIPLGRMAAHDEYRAAVQFLCSDASAYLNGQNIVMDGGRSVW
jgi:NAD(P)-dependent dehydrogenase (short-subunit alcohol dehydrogenase family)